MSGLALGLAGLMPAALNASALIAASDLDLAVDAATAVTPPVYATLMTGSLTTILPASRLYMAFSAAAFHTGAGGVNVAMNFRFRLDGVLLTPGGGTTTNALTSQIQPVVFSASRPVVAGLHTVAVEWAKFGAATQTMNILAATLPDLCHACLALREFRP